MPEPQLEPVRNAPPRRRPAGLVYVPGLLGAEEEAALAGRIAALPFKPFEFHGFTGNRRTVSFGLHYAFDGSGLREAEPIPDWLQPLRARAAALAGREPERLRPCPGDRICARAPASAGTATGRCSATSSGISLLAPAPLRFRRARSGDEMGALHPHRRAPLGLSASRRGAAPNGSTASRQLETLRYSVTLRTLA